MNRIISWIFTPLTVFAFVMSLLVGHLILLIVLALKLPFKKFIGDIFNYIIYSSFTFSGVTFTRKHDLSKIPKNRPLIIVSNHQSMIDIPFIGWVFRDHNPKFVAKRELERGFPYVSMNLRNGAGVLIDRKSPAKAVGALQDYGRYIAENNYAICIFPEGTRARDGKLKNFKGSGIKTLLKVMPNALIVPIAINRSWELIRYKMCPVPFGVRVTMSILPVIEPKDHEPDALIKSIEESVRSEVLN